MRKFSLFVAVGASSLQLARAAELAAPIQPGPWRAVVVNTFFLQGAANIPNFGSDVLTNLAAFEANVSPGVAPSDLTRYARLATALAAATGKTAEDFRALSQPDRMTFLLAAAKAAQASAEADVKPLLERRGEGAATQKALAALADPAQRAWDAEAFYLTPATRDSLKALKEEAVGAMKRRQADVDAWMKTLAAKIHAGAFDSTNTFEKTDEGWRAADFRPLPQYEKLASAFEARLDDLGKTPAGPWRADALRTLEKSLEREDLRKAILEESGADVLTRLDGKARSARANNDVQIRGQMEELASARDRFFSYLHDGRLPRYRDIKRISKYYESAADGQLGMSPSSQWSVASYLTKGDASVGLPSAAQLDQAARELKAAAHKRGLKALIVAPFGFLPMILKTALALGPLWSILGGILVFGGFAVMYANVFIRDELNLDYRMMRARWLLTFFENQLKGRPE